MRTAVAEEQALEGLTRAVLVALADNADAGRLKSEEARDAARAIVRNLLFQASAQIGDPLVARREAERHADVIDAFLTAVGEEAE